MTPTQRTLKALRERGYRAGVVERWLRFAGPFGKRQDFIGFIDIIAFSAFETLGVQCCSGSAAGHYKKIVEERNQECYDWLELPSRRVEIWAWRKVKEKRGKQYRKMIHLPKIVSITLGELDV